MNQLRFAQAALDLRLYNIVNLWILGLEELQDALEDLEFTAFEVYEPDD